MVIVALSVGLGFFNEYRAEAAMATLRSQIHHDAEVLRDGRSCQVLVDNLVPGDVVALRVGAIVPADLRLLASTRLECDEGVLTGESMPASKSAEAVTGSTDPDRPGCAFMGTVGPPGSGSGVVVLTGTATAFGRIAAGPGREAEPDGVRGRAVPVLTVPVRRGRRADRLHLRRQRGAVAASDRGAALLPGHRRGIAPK